MRTKGGSTLPSGNHGIRDFFAIYTVTSVKKNVAHKARQGRHDQDRETSEKRQPRTRLRHYHANESVHGGTRRAKAIF